MLLRTATSLALATACLMAVATAPGAQAQPASFSGNQVVTNGPQGDPPSDWSARQNVLQSHHYTRMLETSSAFRRARMNKECGPISDPQLHATCLASFNQYAPTMFGSSVSPHPYRSNYGR
ncbi:MAG TPA: hypothetical protein VMF05_11805 [Stellaceae bacterium]|nr:hypothetical protein [Stellaceae bacterium]